ncbi:hypothetical protein ACJ41O_010846 [Fusarium nematophilum]
MSQPSTSQLMDVEGPEWSRWIPHFSRRYYYRARYISFDEASSVLPNGRNAIIPDGQGGYLHYEFMGVNDTALSSYQSPAHHTSELSTYSGETPATTVSSQQQPPPRRLLPAPDHVYDGAPTYSGNGMMMSGAIQPSEAEQERRVILSGPRASKGKSVVVKKKDKKRLEVDKRKQVSAHAKVNKWLNSF